MDNQELAAYFDHTLLKPDLQATQIVQLCEEAKHYCFAAVCIPPCYVAQAATLLAGTSIVVATVIGFPFGYQKPEIKMAEAKAAISDGARELDVVINLSALLSENYAYVSDEIHQLTSLAHSYNIRVKWIIESGLLSKQLVQRCCAIAASAGVDFVKTATGYIGPGASVEQVQLLRQCLPANIAIKASGGIRSRQQAQALIDAGASRLGSSSAVAILNQPT
ncbi:MAG: deoxyribose-phosphate aldolase [Chitinophagales bacterium]|nr:deoxyribose-phosphate aldolase [Chitinophagales bacterium]MDW8426929.1 deoxyribose-phosphate aldolase [Chitinophagales bacterium]